MPEIDELPCGCKELGYRVDMDWDELTDLNRRVHTCSSAKYKSRFSGGWICPNIDKLLRKADQERSRKDTYERKRKREGHIPTAPVKKAKPVKHAKVVDLSDL